MVPSGDLVMVIRRSTHSKARDVLGPLAAFIHKIFRDKKYEGIDFSKAEGSELETFTTIDGLPNDLLQTATRWVNETEDGDLRTQIS